MRSRLSLVILTAITLILVQPARGQQDEIVLATEVSFESEDGVEVFADLYLAAEPRTAPVVLLFHQSGSSASEYATVAPILASIGYHCLAVDARGGGDFYGSPNRTIAALEERGGGAQAYFDFKAAISYMREAGFDGPMALWGSSYSAGRLFTVLMENPAGVVAALSFSPGAGFARRGPDGEPSWAERVNTPIFMTWSPEELDDERRARFDLVASADKVLFEQDKGVHGSGTVHPERNPEGWEDNLQAAIAFLKEHL